MDADLDRGERVHAGKGEGIGVLVCESFVGHRGAGCDGLEHFRLASLADLGIPSTCDALR
jgi:hypothetical protein